jgi:hypothetical protein
MGRNALGLSPAHGSNSRVADTGFARQTDEQSVGCTPATIERREIGLDDVTSTSFRFAVVYEVAMKLTELATFEVAHEKLSWPWIAIAPSGRHFGFAERNDGKLRIATRVVEQGSVDRGPAFALPADLALPTAPPKEEPVRDMAEGLHAFAIAPDGQSVAVTGVIGSASVLVTLDRGGERKRSTLEALAGPGFIAQALTFDRSGDRLWISCESETETALVLVAAVSHDLLGIVRSPALPPPVMHELHLHPSEQAVLLLAACGPDGTFARVARITSTNRVKAEWTSMEGGTIPAGIVGFSSDGTRLYLAEADELRTHGWPGLKELASTPFEGDFISGYAGAVIADHVLVDGEDSETKEDAVAMFDPSAEKAVFAIPPVPAGMWAGLVGTNVLLTVEARGEPGRGRVLRIDF